jgi:hypothetical protein
MFAVTLSGMQTGMLEKAALAYRIYPAQGFTLVRSYSKIVFIPVGQQVSWPRSCALVGTSFFQSPTQTDNYYTGDIVVVEADGTILDISGREQDFIHLSDGKTAPFSQLIGSIHTDVWEGIRRFRFEQERVGALEVYLDDIRPSGRDRLREQFETLIAAALGGGVELSFHFGGIDPLRSSSGKEVYFVQRLARISHNGWRNGRSGEDRGKCAAGMAPRGRARVSRSRARGGSPGRGRWALCWGALRKRRASG